MMKTISTLVTGLFLMSFMLPVCNYSLKPKEPIEFNIRATGDAKVPVEEVNIIQEIELDNNKGYLRLLVLRPLEETDFGAYETAYLIYENPLGLPRRHSIFEIGNIASVYDFKQVSENKIELITDLYAYKDDVDLFDIEKQFTITVDLSEVYKAEDRHYDEDDDYSGAMDASVSLKIEKK